tara:strand:+ start:395 stop:853 length:459 start_codon:yes stop_codon:yes gene_type:complete
MARRQREQASKQKASSPPPPPPPPPAAVVIPKNKVINAPNPAPVDRSIWNSIKTIGGAAYELSGGWGQPWAEPDIGGVIPAAPFVLTNGDPIPLPQLPKLPEINIPWPTIPTSFDLGISGIPSFGEIIQGISNVASLIKWGLIGFVAIKLLK